MKNGRICLLGVACLCLFLSVPALAQSPDSPAQDANSAHSQLDATGSWGRVTQLAPNTRLRISAKKNGGDCVLQSASADGVICLHGSTTRVVQREDIKTIKFARRGRSTAGGFAIGVLAGAGIGTGVGSAVNSSDSGTIVHVSGGKSAAVGAGIGAIIGGAAGAIVGYSTDFFSGPVIYKR